MFQGDLYDHQSLVKAIKQVDVVISTVARSHLADQDKIISAIKQAGNVKVFLKSHYSLKCDIMLMTILFDRGSFLLSSETMWTGVMRLNQQRVHTPLKPESAAPLRPKEFRTLTC